MIRCQNSIVIANVWNVHCQLQATTPASSHLISEIFYSLVNRSLWQVTPDNLKRFLVFGFVSSLQELPTLHPIHISPLGLYLANLEAIGLLWWNLDSWPTASSVCFVALHAVCADAPSCWKMNPVGSRRLLQKNDSLVIIYKQYKLLFIKTSLWRHRQ